jgi:hypothetical protein
MSQPALAAPVTEAFEDEVQQALDLCGGDPMKALRITLIANSFLEAQIDHLSAALSQRHTGRRAKRPGESFAASQNTRAHKS